MISLQPPVQQRIPATPSGALRSLETYTSSRAITLIHRRESYSSLRIPFGGLVDIDGSEAVIRAIETTGIEVPIDVVLHIPGGLTLGAEQIAATPADRAARATLIVSTSAPAGSARCRSDT